MLGDTAYLAWRERVRLDKLERKQHKAQVSPDVRAKAKVAAAAYYQKNSEKLIAVAKAWNEANSEKLKVRRVNFLKENPGYAQAANKRYRIKNPGIGTKLLNEWRAKNPGAANAQASKQRTAKLKRTPAWADLKAILEFYKQAAKLTKTTGIPHHVDHKIPLRGKLVSGLHVENNLQVLVGTKNLVKHNTYVIT